MNNLIWIKTKCDNYLRVINKLKDLSISIIDTKYKDNYLYLKVSLKDSLISRISIFFTITFLFILSKYQ